MNFVTELKIFLYDIYSCVDKKWQDWAEFRSCNQQLTQNSRKIFFIKEPKISSIFYCVCVLLWILTRWHPRPRLWGSFGPHFSIQLAWEFAEKWANKCDWQFGASKGRRVLKSAQIQDILVRWPLKQFLIDSTAFKWQLPSLFYICWAWFLMKISSVDYRRHAPNFCQN